jgi:hypothetical protein
MTYEDVFFASLDGVALERWFIRPPNPTASPFATTLCPATNCFLGAKRCTMPAKDGSFHAVGGGFAVFRDITPNSKNIGFSKGPESRQSPFGQAPVVFQGRNFAASLSAVDQLATLGLLIAFLDMS